MSEPAITIHPATPAMGKDLAAVFGTRGDASRCWCQYFVNLDVDTHNRNENRAALRAQLEHHPAPGLVACLDDEPVGWVQIGPRHRFPRLNRDQDSAEAGQWLITCFVIPPRHRRKGVSRHLLTAAIEHARDHGATSIRAYPIDTHAERKPGSDLYTGILSTFCSAGFEEVRRRRNKVTVQIDLT